MKVQAASELPDMSLSSLPERVVSEPVHIHHRKKVDPPPIASSQDSGLSLSFSYSSTLPNDPTLSNQDASCLSRSCPTSTSSHASRMGSLKKDVVDSSSQAKKVKKQVRFQLNLVMVRHLPKDSATYWKKVEKQLKAHHLFHPVQWAFADYFISDHHGQPSVHVGPKGPWAPHELVLKRIRFRSLPSHPSSPQGHGLELNMVKRLSMEPPKEGEDEEGEDDEKEKMKKNQNENENENENEIEIENENENKSESENEMNKETDELIFTMEVTPSPLVSEPKDKASFLAEKRKHLQWASHHLRQVFLNRQPTSSILHLRTSLHLYVDSWKLKHMLESDPESPSSVWQGCQPGRPSLSRFTSSAASFKSKKKNLVSSTPSHVVLG
ncbi:hypothetical protein HMI54_012789 [Coelomomyces lativittatus]|nr:hypothetical protein HMI55_004275 [Coelomomyces lativittatus]KAJ1503621.1 hypothetical protein HMI56_002044 [Coelomomyces lativittatus]KAJ1515158.1 hypothetical protein HMI54_012789 [Coelomomyces lativittatus]